MTRLRAQTTTSTTSNKSTVWVQDDKICQDDKSRYIYIYIKHWHTHTPSTDLWWLLCEQPQTAALPGYKMTRLVKRTRLDKALTHISQISGDCHVNNTTVWVQDDDTCQDDKTKHKAHTPSIAFQHLPPNSARFSYATHGGLFISEQLSTDAVSALRKVWVLTWLQKQPSTQAHT